MGYIYKITNTVNNKSYVGYTENPSARWKGHRHNQGSTLVFQAIKKYGVNKFKFKVIAEDNVDNEQKYIEKYDTIAPNGYNITIGGNLPPNHKGKTYKDIYGKNWKEQIEKRRQTQLEKGGYGPMAHTEATKKKISSKLKGKGNGMYGKKHSVKTLKLISAKRKGVHVGSKNGNAKQFRLISPAGKTHIAHGDLRKKCQELGLSVATVRKSYELNRPMRSGWLVKRV